jgi:hypothetical protein
MVMDRLRRLAIVHGIVGLATCLCLILLYLGAGAFGAINDVGNAALGLLSAALAWRYQQSAAKVRPVFVGVAFLGAVITVVGSILILTDATGFFLAGLVSATGFAVIGVWLVAASRKLTDDPWPQRLQRAGLVAGIVMLLGFVNVPGIIMGLDDLDTAPGWTYIGGLSWAGTYLLFPAWSLRLAGTTAGRIP